MTRAEFSELMAEVAAYYGDKAYSPRMLDVIWLIMQPLDGRAGRAIVEALVQKHPRPPLPAAFKAEAIPFLRAAGEQVKRQEIAASTDCEVCGGSGQMLALLKANPIYEYAFACSHCPAAEIRGFKSFPRWHDGLSDKYKPVSLRRESFNAAAKIRQAEFTKRFPPKPKRSRDEEVQCVRSGEAGDGVLREESSEAGILAPVQGLQEGGVSPVLPGEPRSDPGAAEALQGPR